MPFFVSIRNQIWDSVARGVPFTPPAGLYLALFRSDAGLNESDLEAAQEVDYDNYARVPVRTADLQTIGAADSGSSKNLTAYSFPVATSSGPVPTHMALMDAATGGNVVAWGALGMIGGHTILNETFGFTVGAERLQLILE